MQAPVVDKVLIITSSGGGGLLQAAVAKEQQILAENQNIQIIKRDMLKDWVWKAVGKFSIAYWNGAQRRGFVKAQVWIMHTQAIFDFFSWPIIFYKLLSLLLKERVSRVIDTQAIATSAIIKAIRVYNQIAAKNLFLEKIVVDMPTKRATHYFKSIRRLSQNDRHILRLNTIYPLLEKGETREMFWEKYCGLKESQIDYEFYNVRQSFRSLQNKPRSQETIELCFSLSGEKEWEWMEKSFRRGSIQGKKEGEKAIFLIHPNDRVLTILLGSQPAGEACLEYLKAFLEEARLAPLPQKNTHLFLFSAECLPREKNLFRQVVGTVEGFKEYPSFFSVVPFSFQKDDAIAHLFHRSDLTCTRSGGQTAMELMAVSSGEMWIHSEAKEKKKPLSLEKLLKGIPGWEAASALYLHKLHGAKITTPQGCKPFIRSLFQ